MLYQLNTLYNMDCMDAMRDIPDSYFELAIVDPPYGVGIGTMTYTRSCVNGIGHRKWGSMAAERKDYSAKAQWDIRPTQKYFNELMRISQRQIVWGGNYFSDMLPASKSFLVWNKRYGAKDRNCFADCELAWMSNGMGVARVINYVYNGMIQQDMANKEERFHPTQKPIGLYREILNLYATTADKIIDTHVGSGSSLIACIEQGYDWMGFEIDHEFCEKAQERIDRTLAQGRLAI